MKKKFFKEEKRWYRSVGAWARRGSPTMEYIILIAVGALFAGLLYLAMSDGEGLIQSAMEKKVQEIIQGQLPEGKPSENNPENRGSSDIGNASEIGDPRDIGGNPEIGGSPDAGIPPELGGPSDRSGTTSEGVNPEADGTSPSTSGGTSGGATAEGKSSASQEEGKGGLSGWWDKTKNYVASGQILKDAAHLGKETLDFLILDDVSGCITGKDTDGNQVSGWERGLSCVSLVPVAKWAKFGKYADEAIAFAGKLDGKLVKTRLGEGMQTAKRELDGLFSKGKRVACNCNDNVGKLKKGESNTSGSISWITPGSLPKEEEEAVLKTLKYIDSGTIPNGKLRKKWGSRFRNNEKYLPEGEYKEYRVEPPPGSKKPGPRRIVVNVNTGEVYYTWTHYGDSGKPAFVRVR
jgi:guanyl-specific ribonuclease Sa